MNLRPQINNLADELDRCGWGRASASPQCIDDWGLGGTSTPATQRFNALIHRFLAAIFTTVLGATLAAACPFCTVESRTLSE